MPRRTVRMEEFWRAFNRRGIRKILRESELLSGRLHVQEWKGFVYYLSVIESFLKEAEPKDEYDDCEAWIIGCAVESQVEEHKKKIAEDMDNRLKSLCDSVLARFERMSIGEKDKKRILKQWPKTRKELERKRRWQRR